MWSSSSNSVIIIRRKIRRRIKDRSTILYLWQGQRTVRGWRCVCVITASRCNGKAKTFLSTVSRGNEEGRNCARSLSTRHPFLYSRLWIIYICIFKSYRNSNRFFFEENVDPCRFPSFEWIFVRFPKIQMVSINWPTAINLRATSFFGENYTWKDRVASTFR